MDQDKIIYLDNASTTFVDSEIKESYLKFLEKYPGNSSSIHKLGQESSRVLEKAKGLILSSLNFSNDYEVVFTSGATEANNLAIKGYALAHQNRGKHIIVSNIEHMSILETVKQLEENFSFEVTYLKVDESGRVNLDELKNSINDNTILVSIMSVNNEIGSINNIKEIYSLIKQYPKIAFHTDAVQALGKVKMDYTSCDMMTITAHKIHGLIGAGCLIKKKNISLLPLISGGGQEYNYRSGTNTVALSSCFALSISKIIKNIDENIKKVRVLYSNLIDFLKKYPSDFHINSLDESNPFIVNFSLLHNKASVVVEALSNKNIFVSSTSACHSKGEKNSYVVYAQFGDENLSKQTIRISLDAHNTLNDIDIFKETLLKILKEIKQ